MNRETILDKITKERERQYQLPGSEFDMKNGPNDWVAIASKYLSEGSRFGGVTPSKEDFDDALIKAAALIVAALEHSDHMKMEKRLK
ncbi:MAG: hypothetical protein HC836_33075 [Richelia sp. RM2_1_2]|nr:hypothetical protein [Richelia sp. RM2_1_2]